MSIHNNAHFGLLQHSSVQYHGYLDEKQDYDGSFSLIFTLPEKVGALCGALRIFEASR